MAVSLSTAQLEDRLALLIRAREPGARDVRVTQLMPLAGGNARRAWAFTANCDGHSRDCVLLARVERGQLEVDPRFEFDVLADLARAKLPVPTPFWLDAEGDILGMPGLVMQRGEGRFGIVELLQPGSVITEPVAADLVRLAARLHGLDWDTAQPQWQPGQMLSHWRRQFEAVRMEPLPALGCVFDWLEDHMPTPCRAVLVHGDLRLGNFLHDGTRVSMLLDWELAHVGDPAEDLAWMYRRLWSPEAFLPLDRALAQYREAGGREIEASRLHWYRIFAEARLAVISLTAVRRFIDAETQNLRHAGRASMVNESLLAALRRIGEVETA